MKMFFEGIDRAEVDRALQQVFQVMLNLGKFKKASGFIEFDENVHITFGGGLITRNGTKQIQ